MPYVILLVINAVFVNNFVLSRFLGICPFLGVSRKTDTALGMGMAVIFVMGVASVITYALNLALVAAGIEYLRTIVFILVIACLIQLVEIFVKKFSPSLYSALGVYLPLITTNCAVLGVVVLNVDNVATFAESYAVNYGFAHAMVNSLAAGLGFMLAMVLFAGVRSRLEAADIPKFLQGLPITLIAASIVSVSFLGFGGIVEGFGLLTTV